MNTTSASLLGRLASGTDSTAWPRFVELYTPLLYNWCQRLGLNDADSADFIQEVLVILVQKLPVFSYDANQSFRAWLKTVLMNIWRKYLRKRGRLPTASAPLELLAGSDLSYLIDDAEHQTYLLQRAVQIAETNFEPITWKACWLFVMDHRSAAEVAQELNITVNAVYLAKSRVLRHLRSELAGLIDA
jgi:RNA polymerase sigma-70 factor, ECF subfamily